ncbi:MAG: hypothetical protein FIB05_05080 [Betaproteobacteria bacterium]|nr:hypothetical protein [Betaproteobacteria bacterium]
MRASERHRPAPAVAALAVLAALAGPARAQEGLKPPVNEDQKLPPERPADREIGQRRPGDSKPLEFFPPPADPSQVPGPLPATARQALPVPDRWRIMQALGFRFPLTDPYNQNILKGDLPIGDDPWLKEHFPDVARRLSPDWFFSLGVVSDTLVEARRLPAPVGAQTTERAGAYDVFGQGRQSTVAETVVLSLGLIKGNTTFKPPDYEFRFVPVFNANRTQVEEVRAVRADPRAGTSRTDNHVGVQELFADVHLRNVSARYDFDSVRVGIQPFISDFRGFLFQDVPFGIRFFGTRDNNQWQYNLGWFRRLEKDTNSGLNDVGARMRSDDLFVANAYRQDFPVPGFTSQATAILNVNREGKGAWYNNNGFLERPSSLGDERPRDYTVGYLGWNGDGHFGSWNLQASLYAAVGRDDRHPLAGRSQDIRAGFAAAELSRDFSWVRLRLNALAASGDKDPFDDKATGFDAILENPQFAGADTSFWIRQAVPLVGGGGVALSGRNGVLPSLRSSKDQGQSNFVNPGLLLLGAGADADLLPELRASANLSYLRFQDTTVLGVLRGQAPPDREIGWDVSASVQYRPFMSQNLVLNASAAALLPGKGMKQLYDEDRRGPQYSILVNLLLSY